RQRPGVRGSGAGAAADRDELRGRLDVGRLGAATRAGFHPISRQSRRARQMARRQARAIGTSPTITRRQSAALHLVETCCLATTERGGGKRGARAPKTKEYFGSLLLLTRLGCAIHCK